uniref:Uncharacterized protein n=1 Tax=Lagarostrobos franklinii TaxID=56892 RepID=A0A3Q9WV89_LAGFR|nr:hypothetical protein RF2 [Lagarostrobos franklinii]BBF90866.1 hypothetical protein [Lagarostrobos franklinii]
MNNIENHGPMSVTNDVPMELVSDEVAMELESNIQWPLVRIKVLSQFRLEMTELFNPWNKSYLTESYLLRFFTQIFSRRERLIKLLHFRVIITLFLRDLRSFGVNQTIKVVILLTLPVFLYRVNSYVNENKYTMFIAPNFTKNLLMVPHLFVYLSKYDTNLLNNKNERISDNKGTKRKTYSKSKNAQISWNVFEIFSKTLSIYESYVRTVATKKSFQSFNLLKRQQDDDPFQHFLKNERKRRVDFWNTRTYLLKDPSSVCVSSLDPEWSIFRKNQTDLNHLNCIRFMNRSSPWNIPSSACDQNKEQWKKVVLEIADRFSLSITKSCQIDDNQIALDIDYHMSPELYELNESRLLNQIFNCRGKLKNEFLSILFNILGKDKSFVDEIIKKNDRAETLAQLIYHRYKMKIDGHFSKAKYAFAFQKAFKKYHIENPFRFHLRSGPNSKEKTISIWIKKESLNNIMNNAINQHSSTWREVNKKWVDRSILQIDKYINHNFFVYNWSIQTEYLKNGFKSFVYSPNFSHIYVKLKNRVFDPNEYRVLVPIDIRLLLKEFIQFLLFKNLLIDLFGKEFLIFNLNLMSLPNLLSNWWSKFRSKFNINYILGHKNDIIDSLIGDEDKYDTPELMELKKKRLEILDELFDVLVELFQNLNNLFETYFKPLLNKLLKMIQLIVVESLDDSQGLEFIDEGTISRSVLNEIPINQLIRSLFDNQKNGMDCFDNTDLWARFNYQNWLNPLKLSNQSSLITSFDKANTIEFFDYLHHPRLNYKKRLSPYMEKIHIKKNNLTYVQLFNLFPIHNNLFTLPIDGVNPVSLKKEMISLIKSHVVNILLAEYLCDRTLIHDSYKSLNLLTKLNYFVHDKRAISSIGEISTTPFTREKPIVDFEKDYGPPFFNSSYSKENHFSRCKSDLRKDIYLIQIQSYAEDLRFIFESLFMKMNKKIETKRRIVKKSFSMYQYIISKYSTYPWWKGVKRILLDTYMEIKKSTLLNKDKEIMSRVFQFQINSSKWEFFETYRFLLFTFPGWEYLQDIFLYPILQILINSRDLFASILDLIQYKDQILTHILDIFNILWKLPQKLFIISKWKLKKTFSYYFSIIYDYVSYEVDIFLSDFYMELEYYVFKIYNDVFSYLFQIYSDYFSYYVSFLYNYFSISKTYRDRYFLGLSRAKEQIELVKEEIKEQIKSVTGEIESVTGEIKSVTGEIESVTGEIESVTGEIESVKEEIENQKEQLKMIEIEIRARGRKIPFTLFDQITFISTNLGWALKFEKLKQVRISSQFQGMTKLKLKMIKRLKLMEIFIIYVKNQISWIHFVLSLTVVFFLLRSLVFLMEILNLSRDYFLWKDRIENQDAFEEMWDKFLILQEPMPKMIYGWFIDYEDFRIPIKAIYRYFIRKWSYTRKLKREQTYIFPIYTAIQEILETTTDWIDEEEREVAHFLIKEKSLSQPELKLLTNPKDFSFKWTLPAIADPNMPIARYINDQPGLIYLRYLVETFQEGIINYTNKFDSFGPAEKSVFLAFCNKITSSQKCCWDNLNSSRLKHFSLHLGLPSSYFSKRILLIGPMETGRSFLVKSLAADSYIPLIRISLRYFLPQRVDFEYELRRTEDPMLYVPSIFDDTIENRLERRDIDRFSVMERHMAMKRIEQLIITLEMAKAMSPCVIWIPNIHELDSGSLLLCILVKRLFKENFPGIVIASTHIPKKVDPFPISSDGLNRAIHIRMLPFSQRQRELAILLRSKGFYLEKELSCPDEFWLRAKGFDARDLTAFTNELFLIGMSQKRSVIDTNTIRLAFNRNTRGLLGIDGQESVRLPYKVGKAFIQHTFRSMNPLFANRDLLMKRSFYFSQWYLEPWIAEASIKELTIFCHILGCLAGSAASDSWFISELHQENWFSLDKFIKNDFVLASSLLESFLAEFSLGMLDKGIILTFDGHDIVRNHCNMLHKGLSSRVNKMIIKKQDNFFAESTDEDQEELWNDIRIAWAPRTWRLSFLRSNQFDYITRPNQFIELLQEYQYVPDLQYMEFKIKSPYDKFHVQSKTQKKWNSKMKARLKERQVIVGGESFDTDYIMQYQFFNNSIFFEERFLWNPVSILFQEKRLNFPRRELYLNGQKLKRIYMAYSPIRKQAIKNPFRNRYVFGFYRESKIMYMKEWNLKDIMPEDHMVSFQRIQAFGAGWKRILPYNPTYTYSRWLAEFSPMFDRFELLVDQHQSETTRCFSECFIANFLSESYQYLINMFLSKRMILNQMINTLLKKKILFSNEIVHLIAEEINRNKGD